MNICFYWNVFKNLVWSDLIVFRQNFLNKFINISLWVILTLVVMAYVMPFFGLPGNFGPFQLAGILAAIGLFEAYASIVNLATDLEGDRIINYTLTIPIPSRLVILSKAAYYFIIYFTLSILMLPIGKLSLWNQLDLGHISYSKLMLIFIVQNVFYACFVMWLASITTMSKFEDVWCRFTFPMWFLGGFQFSWSSLYHTIPILAFINLINPMVYITEALRAAMLGQADYLNFWLCISALISFSLFFLALGMRNLKKRLDFV